MASKPFSSGHHLAAADVNDLTGIYDRSTTTVDVVSTTAETSVYSKVIGAGHMSSDRMLRLTLIADALLNSGTAGLTFRVKLGGTTISTVVLSVGANATRYPASLEIRIANLGSASSQLVTVRTPNWTMIGAKDDNSIVEYAAATSAVNTAAAATLDVTVQHDASSANRSYRKRYAVLELL